MKDTLGVWVVHMLNTKTFDGNLSGQSGHNADSGKTAGFIKMKVCSSKKQSTSSYKGIGVDSAGEK